jgi:hypothetical protein
LAGFSVVLKSKKTVKYLPDQERDSDGLNLGFNYAWHDSERREKNLIIEAPRPTVRIVKFGGEKGQATVTDGNVRLPEMMEAILSNMQHN